MQSYLNLVADIQQHETSIGTQANQGLPEAYQSKLKSLVEEYPG